jgi:sugar lactone lactonase YvrE
MKRWLLALPLILLLAPAALPSGTTTWEMNNYRDFIRGAFDGVSLSLDGRLRLAPKVETVFSSDQPVIWSIAQAPDGALYAGTGHRGRVYRIDKSGKSSLLWSADEAEVFAVALDPKGVLYAATSPNGKIYRIENGKAVEFFAPKTTYIWSLAFSKDGTLFVGTGDQGLVFRVDAAGKGEVYYDTGQAHVTCLALDAQGRLLAGSEPNGILYRIEAKDRAFVLYDANLSEIRSISVASNGVIYAAAQGGASTRRALTPAITTPASAGPGQVTAPASSITVTAEDMQAGVELKPGAAKPVPAAPAPVVTSQFTAASDFAGVEKSALYKISPDNTIETVWTSKDENVYDLLVSAGEIFFATDMNGRIYRLNSDGKATLLVQTNEGEATRLLQTPAGLVAATGDLGKILRLEQNTGTAGSYEAPVHDAGTVARWGRLSWLTQSCRDCRVAFSTRSGNSMRPDRTWSDWSARLTAADGAPVTSPNARYIQWKTEFTGATGQSPILDSVTLAYLPQNSPPVVRNITVTTQMATPASARSGMTQVVSSSYSVTVTDTGESLPSTSSGTPTQVLPPSAVRQLQITWQADDPDNDKLIFALYFRGEGENEWKLIKSNLTDNTYTMDGDVLADGKYFFRVTASDLPGNPPGSAREAELISPPILVDNTPPVVTASAPRRTGAAVEIDFEAFDPASPIRRAEYSVDAGPWAPAEPLDGILDSSRERIRVRLDNVSPGEHLIVLRAYDAAGNAGLAKVVLR